MQRFLTAVREYDARKFCSALVVRHGVMQLARGAKSDGFSWLDTADRIIHRDASQADGRCFDFNRVNWKRDDSHQQERGSKNNKRMFRDQLANTNIIFPAALSRRHLITRANDQYLGCSLVAAVQSVAPS